MNGKKVIVELKEKYANDGEALEEIRRAEKTIEYYRQQGQEEKAQAHLNNLKAFLHDWY